MAADAAFNRDEIAALLARDINVSGHEPAVRRAARRRRLAEEFAASRGWNLSDRPFGLIALKRGTLYSHIGSPADVLADELPHALFDHKGFFRTKKRAIGVAAHLYRVDVPTIEAFVKEYGLKAETPYFPSWWWPGVTTLVVYVGDAGTSGDVALRSPNARARNGFLEVTSPTSPTSPPDSEGGAL